MPDDVFSLLVLKSKFPPGIVSDVCFVECRCGMKQSGGYLDGVAPDGLLGLGPGESSVPSFLANSGLIHNSFSLCFNEDDSGRMFFGDQGPTIQQSTPFLPLDGL